MQPATAFARCLISGETFAFNVSVQFTKPRHPTECSQLPAIDDVAQIANRTLQYDVGTSELYRPTASSENQRGGKNGERAPPLTPSPTRAQAASIVAATSHRALLIRTSCLIEVIRRVRTSRPLLERRLRPPRSRFSCTRFRVL